MTYDEFDLDSISPELPTDAPAPDGTLLGELAQRYHRIFPDDGNLLWYHVCGFSSTADRIKAYQWGIENRRHWWEYPDLHLELVPGYWERMYKEHPDRIY